MSSITEQDVTQSFSKKHKYTHILSLQSEMNDGYILGATPITDECIEALFRGQRILESQFMQKMPVIIMFHQPPDKAIHVAQEVSLLPAKQFDTLEDIDHFLVNKPFCDMLDVPFLDVFDALTSNPDVLLDTDKNTYMIGCAYATQAGFKKNAS